MFQTVADYINESQRAIGDFIWKISHKYGHKVKVIVGTESLPAGYAARFENELRNRGLANCYNVYDCNIMVNGGIGVPVKTKNDVTLNCISIAQNYINDKLRISAGCEYYTNINSSKNYKLMILEMTYTQFKNYKSNGKGGFSGKHAGNDDIPSAFLVACHVRYIVGIRKPENIKDIYGRGVIIPHIGSDTTFLAQSSRSIMNTINEIGTKRKIDTVD